MTLIITSVLMKTKEKYDRSKAVKDIECFLMAKVQPHKPLVLTDLNYKTNAFPVV